MCRHELCKILRLSWLSQLPRRVLYRLGQDLPFAVGDLMPRLSLEPRAQHVRKTPPRIQMQICLKKQEKAYLLLC